MAIAFVIAIGVVVDVRIDFTGAGRMLFSSLAFPLRLFRMLFSRELGLLGAPGTGLCLLAQARSLVTPLLEPPLASDDGESDREQRYGCGDHDSDDQCCAHAGFGAPAFGAQTLRARDRLVLCVNNDLSAKPHDAHEIAQISG